MDAPLWSGLWGFSSACSCRFARVGFKTVGICDLSRSCCRQCVRYTESMPMFEVFPRANDRRSPVRPLETQRLILREMRSTDVESLHRLFSDPLLMRFWRVFTQAETE